MPKLTNLVPVGTLLWYNDGTSMRTAEYRGKTVDMLHEIEVVPNREDISGPIIAVKRSALLVPTPPPSAGASGKGET